LKSATDSPEKTRKHATIPINGHEPAAYQLRTRQRHAQERAQDCVEAIADLIGVCGEARVTDLAKLMEVSHGTVIRTVERLQRGGLVKTQPHHSIFKTKLDAN